jgi:hypothetical protein
VNLRPAAALGLALLAGCVDRIEHASGGWEGGPDYYRRWSAGPPADPSYFTIGVWLQSPMNAPLYKAIGINTFIGLWMGPTDKQLDELKTAGVATACRQNPTSLARVADPTIVAWQGDDQPDDAQPLPTGGYGACLDADTVVANYKATVAKDATHPVFLAFGQGVAVDRWYGRGPCTGRLDLYPSYIRGGDILSFHVYPVNSTDPMVAGKLWLVATGVDHVRAYSGYRKPVWAFVEGVPIDDPVAHKPTPAQIKTEAWMALTHGAMGIIWFSHVFHPKFSETGILDDPTTKAAVRDINQEILSLAPALNTPSLPNDGVARTSNPSVPVDVMLKRVGDTTYLFAVAMRDGVTTASFTVPGLPASAVAEVLSEKRKLPIQGGTFQDDFASYGLHLYRITAAP